MEKVNSERTTTGLEIAVIGMAGRFPGSQNLEQFWNNLENSVESIHFYSDAELDQMNINKTDRLNPHFVKSGGALLENKEYFDAAFFGYTPREADIMDPQIRIFHECAWEALENGGYEPGNYNGSIGLYAGGSSSFYWEALVLLTGKGGGFGDWATSQLSHISFLCTRISYNFNLKGPAVSIQTACSTSLVAVHLACRALLTGECNMALAGGITIGHLEENGYLYQEGMIASPDGHCRAFDANGRGTVGGKGAGVVLLKPLKKALDNRDYIHAVIKGSAINNDGNRKVGYSAPSIKAQAEVIRAALLFSRVKPETISYIEAHGTGTPLGDPVEMSALIKAFNTNKKGFCAIGSVKTNIGHLDSAAGVAGLIKTILALKHRKIPPSINFETPNPNIDFDNSPFYVNTKLTPWKNDLYPLRAGVSSFGIGGTNTHVILEEAPPIPLQKETQTEVVSPAHLLLLSARTASALEKISQNLSAHLKNNPHLNLADVTYTLQLGRKPLNHRKMAVCSSLAEATEIITASVPVPGKILFHSLKELNRKRPLVFMFSGQGSQYVNMGLEFYHTETIFKNEIDQCLELLKPLTGCDLKSFLYPGESKILSEDMLIDEEKITETKNKINHVLYSGPIKFAVEYAMAKLLMTWGFIPDAMIGHSFGEYIVACLAGVFNLEDALTLVVLRGQVMEKTAPGAMMSVPLPEEQIQSFIKAYPDLSLAAVNTDSMCIVSGPTPEVDSLENQLKQQNVECLRVNFPRASHSALMEPVLDEFDRAVAKVKLNIPQISYISGLTGKWMTNENALDHGYWSRHLRHTVRFKDGIGLLIKELDPLFVQVGCDRGLPYFVSQHPRIKEDNLTLNLFRHYKDPISDRLYLLTRMGELWLWGIQPDWNGFYSSQKRSRLPLPTYPFEGQRYWIDNNIFDAARGVFSGKGAMGFQENRKNPNISEWFYVPSWVRSPLTPSTAHQHMELSSILVFLDNFTIGSQLALQLEKEGHRVITITVGTSFQNIKENVYQMNPREKNDYESLIVDIKKNGITIQHILHLWSVTGAPTNHNGLELSQIDPLLDRGFFNLIYLVQALGNNAITYPLHITVVTDHMQEITGSELHYPVKATILGAVKVIPIEYSNISCKSVDIVLSSQEQDNILIKQLLAEIKTTHSDPVVAYRGAFRWTPTYRPLHFNESMDKTIGLKQHGVYLITGGTGGIGMEFAQFLAKTLAAQLVLVGRSALPEKNMWPSWLETHETNHPLSVKIQRLIQLEKMGAQVITADADVTDLDRMQQIIVQTEKQFGPINGVIHAAGVPGGGVIHLKNRDILERDMKAKIKGTIVLQKLLANQPLDFFLLCSSINAILPAFGQIDYSSANAFLDAFANSTAIQDNRFSVSVNWGGWKNIGMSVAVEKKHEEVAGEEMIGMTGPEGLEAFSRILGNPLPQVIVSPTNLDIMVQRFNTPEPAQPTNHQEHHDDNESNTLFQRPELSTLYEKPGNKTEEQLCHIWQNFFGYQQVGINDDFFELGGDSLKATMMISLIHEKLNIKIPLTEIFRTPTISGLTLFLREASEDTREIFTSIPLAEKKEYYPQSSAQKRLFFLDFMENIGTTYNNINILKIKGQLDIKRFEDTFKALIIRHEILRTSFELIEHEPIQRIHDTVSFSIRQVEAGTHDIQEVIKAQIQRHDLSTAPLFRVTLIALAAVESDAYLFLMDVHHIISDGTSLEILSREFVSLHENFELPPQKIQYKDFTMWQYQQAYTDRMKAQENYWLDIYADTDNIPRLNLPTDFQRPDTLTFAGYTYEFALSPNDSAGLKQIGVQCGATLYMVLLAAFNVLLQKYSAQDDIIVGCAVAGRPHSDFQRIIGMFVNALAIRNHPHEEKTFSQFLDEVKTNSVNAFENQDLQFEDLINKLDIAKDTAQNPLFDTLFVVQNFQKSSPNTGDSLKKGVEFSPYFFERGTSNFELVLLANDLDNQVYLSLQYQTALFKSSTIEKMALLFIKIIQQLVVDRDIRIRDIKLPYELAEARVSIPIDDEGDFDF